MWKSRNSTKIWIGLIHSILSWWKRKTICSCFCLGSAVSWDHAGFVGPASNTVSFLSFWSFRDIFMRFSFPIPVRVHCPILSKTFWLRQIDRWISPCYSPGASYPWLVPRFSKEIQALISCSIRLGGGLLAMRVERASKGMSREIFWHALSLFLL